MPTVADVAQIWQQNGVSVIPILPNQTKRPAIRWSAYQQQLPTDLEVKQWWGGEEQYGLALVCGPVSGNLEMCEIEGRALTEPGALLDLIIKIDEAGAGAIWDLLTGADGYAEDSPSGGMHLLYRIVDHPVPGNTKIAADEHHVVLAETRGHGGYVIVAPTGGHCHPTGDPWRLVNGNYGQLPTITWAERNLFHACLKTALDRTPPPPVTTELVPVVAPAMAFSGIVAGASTSPGDDFEAQTDWADILEPHGWRLTMRLNDGERHWVRPGKDARDGMSATTGRAQDRDRLYVFSTSTLFEAEVPYTKFGAYALLNWGGDHKRAASDLARRGFGERRDVISTVDLGEWEPPQVTPDTGQYTEDDMGNSQLLADTVRGRYRYIWEEKQFYKWNGVQWVRDVDQGIYREWEAITREMMTTNPKWANKSRMAPKITAAINGAKALLAESATAWAPNRDLVNVGNGVLNLKDRQLVPHDPKHLMVQTFGTSYLPEATCPAFQRFMGEAVPDDRMRAYVQRALGYSMLGKSDLRSIFIIYGPSGTGKTTLIETMNRVLGEYAGVAASGTFRHSMDGKGPNPDLHMLRGKRFVTTSETSESMTFDEDLIKRISGQDQITSRSLYQESVTWTPECALWVATNNPPRFSSDDDAIWRRTKLIPFLTVFLGQHEIPGYAHEVLAHEAPGILNWLLDGLQDYLANGLREPGEVHQLAIEQRNDSDSVARFIQDRQADGLIVVGANEQMLSQELYRLYVEWAHQVGERRLGNRRFGNRLMSVLPAVQRDTNKAGKVVWSGLSYRNPSGWMSGGLSFPVD